MTDTLLETVVFRNSRHNALEAKVDVVIGKYADQIAKILKLDSNGNNVWFQVSTLDKSTASNSKPSMGLVNATRYGKAYTEIVEGTENDGKNIKYKHTGIGWHTVYASVASLAELIKQGYVIRYGLKEGGNVWRDHYIGCQFIAFDLDKENHTLSVEDTLAVLQENNLNPFSIYYSPSAKPELGNFNARLVLRFDQFISFDYQKTLKLIQAIVDVIPSATVIKDPARLFNGTLLSDLAYFNFTAVNDYDALCDRFVPYFVPDLEKSFKKSSEETNQSRKQVILKLIDEKIWIPILNNSQSMEEALETFFPGWDLEPKKVSDPEIEFQFHCSNPMSESNKTGTSLTLCYDSSTEQPPYWLDGTSCEISGSIVHWFYMIEHHWNYCELSYEEWFHWALKVCQHHDYHFIDDEIQLFGISANFQLFTLKKNLRYDELKKRFTFDAHNVYDNIEGSIFGAYRSQFDLKTPTAYLHEMAYFVAKQHSFHPVRDYLLSLDFKDTLDLDTLAKSIFNIDTPIYAKMLKKWLLAAVSRVFQPGIKFDQMLVLQGKQGIYKSTFFSSLCKDSENWFTDNVGQDTSQKDEVIASSSHWIVEHGELNGTLNKREVAAMRTLISRQVDKVRKPYMREMEEIPRTFVFGASVNERNFLTDLEGNRRYWVIPVETVNIDFIYNNRDLIWWCVYKLYLKGVEKLYFDHSEDVIEINRLNTQYTIDSMFADVCDRIANADELTTNTILTDYYHLSNATKSQQMELSKYLVDGGWTRDNEKKQGKLGRARYWRNPIKPNPDDTL